MKINALEVAKLAALAAAGFAVVRIVQKTRDGINAGADAAKAVVNAVAEVVSTDLNPASDKNLAYRGVNSVGAQVTNDPHFNLGNSLFEWLNADKVAKEKAMLQGSPVASDAADVQRQVAAQESFRRSEIVAENEAQKAAERADYAMSASKSNFRLLEITRQNDPTYEPGWVDGFLNGLANRWKN